MISRAVHEVLEQRCGRRRAIAVVVLTVLGWMTGRPVPAEAAETCRPTLSRCASDAECCSGVCQSTGRCGNGRRGANRHQSAALRRHRRAVRRRRERVRVRARSTSAHVLWTITNDGAGSLDAGLYDDADGYALASTVTMAGGATETWRSGALGTVLFDGMIYVEIGGGQRMWVHTGVGNTVLADGPGYVGGFAPDLAEVQELPRGGRVERVIEGRRLVVQRVKDGVVVGIGG